MKLAQLVITHGISDLQLLVRDENGMLWRAAPDKTIVRRFHEWLLDKKDAACVVSLPEGLQERSHEASISGFQDERFALWIENSQPEASPERDGQGRLQLVLPKIAPALQKWLDEQERGAQRSEPSTAMAAALQRAAIKPRALDSVLIYSTDRGGSDPEPIATPYFLMQWLGNLGVDPDMVQECVYLRPDERLEGTDTPIATDVARRIEMVLGGWYKREKYPPLLLATVGGIPEVKPLLAELALMFAGEQAQSLFKTEHGSAGLVRRSPTDAVRTRRTCLDRVNQGNLLDAWAIAAGHGDDRDTKRWTLPLQQAAQLLNGNPVGQEGRLPALQAILENAKTVACLLVAIRVETALLTERWLEAINGTLTFLEAAFHDAINAWAKNNLEDYQPRRRYMRFKDAPPPALLQKGALQKGALQKWEGRDAGPLVYQANMVGEHALLAWGEVLGNDAIGNLRLAVYGKNRLGDGDNFRLADYRNFNTHGVMIQEEIDEAIRRFIGTNIWSQVVNTPANRPKPGKCFLSQEQISKTVQSLMAGRPVPEDLYQDLIKDLKDLLTDPWSPPLPR